MKLYIRNMVCGRCKMIVKAELEKAGLHPLIIVLGEVTIEEKKMNQEQMITLTVALERLGFELMDDKRSKLIKQVKTFVIESIHDKNEPPKKKYSELISQHLHHDYSYISKLFSEVEGITIEQYIINQKTEKVKELLLYNELSLGQIAFRLDYSSAAHLSAQFKKVTGLTPSYFKTIGQNMRKPLDKM